MDTPVKLGRKPSKPLKEDIFSHLDSLYRSARRAKDYVLAVKIVEVCIKAKQVLYKQQASTVNIQAMSDAELEKLLQSLQQE